MCGALALSSARADDARPDPRATETLPHDEALQALGRSLGASVKATQSDPSIPDILNALDKNIAAAKHIREMVGGQRQGHRRADCRGRAPGIGNREILP